LAGLEWLQNNFIFSDGILHLGELYQKFCRTKSYFFSRDEEERASSSKQASINVPHSPKKTAAALERRLFLYKILSRLAQLRIGTNRV
jgi:hypothetical protein